MSFYLHLSGTFIFQSQWPQLFPTQFFSFKTKQNILQIDKWIQLKCRFLKIFLHKNISLKTNSPNCLFQKWFLWNNWLRQIYLVTRKNNSKKTFLFTYPFCEFKVLPSRKWYTFSFACTSCFYPPVYPFEISLRIVLCQGAKHGTNQCVTFQHWTWRTRNFIVINNQIWWSSLTKNFDLQTNVGCPCLICTLIGQFDIFDA